MPVWSRRIRVSATIAIGARHKTDARTSTCWTTATATYARHKVEASIEQLPPSVLRPKPPTGTYAPKCPKTFWMNIGKRFHLSIHSCIHSLVLYPKRTFQKGDIDAQLRIYERPDPNEFNTKYNNLVQKLGMQAQYATDKTKVWMKSSFNYNSHVRLWFSFTSGTGGWQRFEQPESESRRSVRMVHEEESSISGLSPIASVLFVIGQQGGHIFPAGSGRGCRGSQQRTGLSSGSQICIGTKTRPSTSARLPWHHPTTTLRRVRRTVWTRIMKNLFDCFIVI